MEMESTITKRFSWVDCQLHAALTNSWVTSASSAPSQTHRSCTTTTQATAGASDSSPSNTKLPWTSSSMAASTTSWENSSTSNVRNHARCWTRDAARKIIVMGMGIVLGITIVIRMEILGILGILECKLHNRNRCRHRCRTSSPYPAPLHPSRLISA